MRSRLCVRVPCLVFAPSNKNIFRYPSLQRVFFLWLIFHIFLCNEANQPSEEHSLHHNNNLLDANLAKNASGIDSELKKNYKAVTSRSTSKKKFAKLFGRTSYILYIPYNHL